MTDWRLAGDETMAAIAADIAGFRARRRKHPLLPYESLDPIPSHLLPGFDELLEDRIANGYSLGPHTLPSIVGPIDWPAQVRPFALHLDAWRPISDLLMGYSLKGNPRWLAAALLFARGWMAAFHDESMAIGPDPAALEASLGPMRWFDMTVGFRVYRLAYLADLMARDPAYSDGDVRQYMQSLVFHCQLLARDDFFQSHNNHGMFQALGELAATNRFRREPFFKARRQAAAQRVARSIAQQFHGNGVHREHSPGYHVMVLGALLGARESGLITSGHLAQRIDDAEEVLSWFVQPGGKLLMFGDTDQKAMDRGAFPAAMFRSPEMKHRVSAGTEGTPPPRGVLALTNEGYAIARSEPPSSGGKAWWCLAQIAAFQSRIHKHADDLSFIWSDRGQQILVDPGGYGRAQRTEQGSLLSEQGFWYEGAERIYVESTRAHNTIEIDGRSYDRKRRPYGSALRYAGEQHGLIVTECEVRQFEAVKHWRVLVLSPGSFLLVVDRLTDVTGATHDLRQRFLFHPDWEVAHEPDSECDRLIATRGASTRRVAIISLAEDASTFDIARGQVKPELLGWYSDRPWSLVPAAAICVSQLQRTDAVFATLLSLDASAVPDRRASKIRHSMRPSIFAWRVKQRVLRLEMRRGEAGEPVSVRML